MKNKFISMLTAAGLLLTSAAAMPPVMAADEPVTDPVLGVLPDWVPQDFADAMQFYNTHGKSYVADDIICLVRPMLQYKEDDYSYSLSGSMTSVNTPAGSEPRIYELTIPEEPDPDDAEAVAAYKEYCEKIGLYSYDISFFSSYLNCKTQYAFEVELFHVLDGLDLTVTWLENSDGETQKTGVFTFENEDGMTTETDLFGWVPDSPAEFDEFLQIYGYASVHGGYLTYCADVNYSTGASLSVEQSGEGKVEQVMESSCNGFELIPLDGSSSQSVIVYKPAADGQTDITWSIGRTWSEEEPFETTTGQYEISDNGTSITDLAATTEGVTAFSFFDKDTGELISIPEDCIYANITRVTKQTPMTSDYYEITQNPLKIDSINAYDPECTYYVSLSSDAGSYEEPEFEVRTRSKGYVEVFCYLKWSPSGDLNSDRYFSIADAVTMQKWLLGESVDIADWMSADFCRDGQLDVFDLCVMRQELVDRNMVGFVEPDKRVLYGTPITVMSDSLKLYSGPGEDYEVIAELKQYEGVREMGYNYDNDTWLFTEYNGRYGWIKTVEDDGETPTIQYMLVADKPVIYLYPEQETDVRVELELTGMQLSTTYPKYNSGWDVTASPDGTLLNKADGTHYRYLFWDAVDCRTRFDFSEGFCVAGSDVEGFLREKLTYMGLTEDEMNEFIVYWLPRMEHNAYDLIAFQGEAYTDSAKLDITPEPDSMLRVFMAYVPLDEPVDIEPQQLSTFERTGFTVVEWGGCEVK